MEEGGDEEGIAIRQPNERKARIGRGEGGRLIRYYKEKSPRKSLAGRAHRAVKDLEQQKKGGRGRQEDLRTSTGERKLNSTSLGKWGRKRT